MKCEKCGVIFSPPDWWWDDIQMNKKNDTKGLMCPECGHQNKINEYT